ncbi:dermonecrotic toxin domain-containing protein [Pseudomonas syringae]
MYNAPAIVRFFSMGLLTSSEIATMLFEYLTDTPLMERLLANDPPSQITLTRKLSRLNRKVMELLVKQPDFEAFVQSEFDQQFSELTPQLGVGKGYVQSREPQQPTTDDMPLPPTLLDAVVQRIATGQASTYASGDTVFLRAPVEGGDPQPEPALTAQALDGFVDSLATQLPARYKAFMHSFWSHTLEGSSDVRTRKQRLIDTRIEQLRTELALLKNDGLFTAAGEALFDKVLRAPSALDRRAFESYKPCVYGLAVKGAAGIHPALYGAFILTARDPQDAESTVVAEVPDEPQVRAVHAGMNLGSVLLFSPDTGLEEFDSLASLDRELHRRLNHPQEFTRLLALMAQNDQPHGLALHRERKPSEQFKYLEWLDSPFSHAVEDQCLKLHEDFIATVTRYQVLRDRADPAWLPQSLDQATDLERAFDSNGVLVARFGKRGQAQLKTFLEGADNADKLAWHTAMRNYCDALANLPESEGQLSLAQFSDRTALLAYSNKQLRALLTEQFGLHVDPDTIVIHTREPYVPTRPYVPGAPASGTVEGSVQRWVHRKRNLTELALENVGGLDFNFTNFSRLTDNNDVAYTALTPEQLKDLVRSANIGDRYDAFLKDRLIASPEALAQKGNFARCLALQVRLDAIEAKIAGDFLPDRLARGFNWVQAVLDEPVDSDRRQTVEGQRIVVQSLRLRGERVRGVWLFRAASSSVGSTVVYAPQAPGGRLFYEFSNDRLSSDFAFNSFWRDYLLGRVVLAQRKRTRSILHGRGDVTLLNMPRIADNIFEEAYEVEASFAINDAADQSTTTGETNVDTAVTVATAVFDIVTVVLPIKIMLPINLVRSLYAVFKAVDAASLGDREEAAHYIVRALGELAGALIDGAMGAGARTGTRVASSAPRGLNPQMALRTKPADVRVLSGWEGKGIYYRVLREGGGREYFMNEQNRWFSIIDDGAEQAWRIKDVRRPHRYHHDLIRLDQKGRWEVGSPAGRGLRGGLSPDEELKQLYPFLDEAKVRRVFESFNFPRERELEFQLSLVHYLRSGTALDPFHQFLMVTPQRLTARLRGVDLPGRPLTPVDVTPGPSQAGPVRPPQQRFVDWGQTIDPVQLQLQLKHAEQGIYVRVGGPPELIGTEYIKIDQHYFPILPPGAVPTRAMNTVFMRDPTLSLRTYEQFESMLIRDLFDQPRLATFAAADGRWVNPRVMPFQKTMAASVAEAFPMLTATSVENVARALFNAANPNGLTAWGASMMQRTLRHWRAGASVVPAHLGEPMTLLPRSSPTVQGHWLLNDAPRQYSQLNYRTDRIGQLFKDALKDGDRPSLRALMVEVLTRDGYQFDFSYPMPGELLFRRPGSQTLYWLQLQRTSAGVVSRSGVNAPSPFLMSTSLNAQVGAAQSGNNLVSLMGGINHSLDGATSIFVIRI